jgi:hypothetical protein
MVTNITRYYYDDQIKECKIGRHIARIGEMRTVYKDLIEKPEGYRPFGIPRRKWGG